MADTSYWHGPGYADGHSRIVEAARAAVRDAEYALHEAMKSEYPMDARVRVKHHRGEFFGVVTGWDINGTRVCVRNESSGKVSKWWAAHVELAGASHADN